MSKSVLIADDAAFMREMLRDILTDADYQVIAEAEDGEKAIETYKKCHPDLVTLDIVMPGKTGLDVLSEIISLDPGACIVMCSALGQEALVMEALEKGAREYIIKPFKPDQVLASVERALQKSSQG